MFVTPRLSITDYSLYDGLHLGLHLYQIIQKKLEEDKPDFAPEDSSKKDEISVLDYLGEASKHVDEKLEEDKPDSAPQDSSKKDEISVLDYLEEASKHVDEKLEEDKPDSAPQDSSKKDEISVGYVIAKKKDFLFFECP